jgi:superfamily II RNA helicase
MLHVFKISDTPGPVETPAIVFPYEPDNFQRHAFSSLEKGHHLLVTAHTGSGKTSIGEYAMGKAIREGKKVIYTAPIKALSNQIYGDLKRKYPHWDLGIKTGDIDLKSDAQAVLMTTEILRNNLFKSGADLENIGVVIFDEVHYIKDRERGSVWEESIIMMPPHIQMVLLSATLPDAVEFGTWVATCKQRDVSFITTEIRVVPLTHYIMTGPTTKEVIMTNENLFDTKAYLAAVKDYSFRPTQLNLYIKAMDLPAMFFCFSRKKCESHAKSVQCSLVDQTEATAIGNLYAALIRKFDKAVETTKQAVELLPLLLKGVGFHHAGLLSPLKEIVQTLFTQGLIKVLFVTETFAAGVNMPAKTVVFTGLTKFETFTNDFRLLFTEEYKQMAGRAGRRGIDTKGVVILLPFRSDDFPDGGVMRNMLAGKVNPIISRLKFDFSYILKSILNNRSILDTVNQSLYTSQLKTRIQASEKHLEELSLRDNDIPLCNFDPVTDKMVQMHCHYTDRMLAGKQVRAYHKAVTEFPGGLPALEKSYQHYAAEQARKKKITDERLNIVLFQTEISEELRVKCSFLHRHNFLSAERFNFSDYTSADITYLGVACTEINECDPHLLARCIYEGLFDPYSTDELIAAMGLFLGSEKNRELKYSDFAVKFRPIYQMEEIVNADRRRGGFDDLPPISDYWVNSVYAWITRGAIGELYDEEGNREDLGEGEFVKAILKVANICEEVLAVAKLIQKDDLAKKLERAKERLIWGIVTPTSLYI